MEPIILPGTRSVLCLILDLSAKCEAPGVRRVTSAPPAPQLELDKSVLRSQCGEGGRNENDPYSRPFPQGFGLGLRKMRLQQERAVGL